RIFLDELHTSQLAASSPILQYPQNQQEWQWACSSLSHAVCIPWGANLGMDLPGTARLRYLVDDRMASMAFRLPVARDGDLPGIPIRSLEPTTGKSLTVRTMKHGFYAASTMPSTQDAPSTPITSHKSTPRPETAPPE